MLTALKIPFLVGFILLSLNSLTQDGSIKKLQSESSRTIKKDPADTIPQVWKKGGIYTINLSQGSLSNWAAGGDNFSISVNSYLGLHAFYKKGHHSWDNTFDFNLGYVNTTSLGARKNDDRLDILSKYGHRLTEKLNLAGLVNFRSQLFDGYTYSDDKKTFSSAFLSPAYLIVSPGIDWKPDGYFSLFVSPITARWVIVKDDTLSAKGVYGVDPGEHSILEFGAFLTANYLRDLSPNVTYKARLDLFSNYRHNPKNIDVFMTNMLALKISKVFSASWNIDLIYDDDVRIFGENQSSAALQVKSIIGFGLQLKF
jgi:hypothetical protein